MIFLKRFGGGAQVSLNWTWTWTATAQCTDAVSFQRDYPLYSEYLREVITLDVLGDATFDQVLHEWPVLLYASPNSGSIATSFVDGTQLLSVLRKEQEEPYTSLGLLGPLAHALAQLHSLKVSNEVKWSACVGHDYSLRWIRNFDRVQQVSSIFGVAHSLRSVNVRVFDDVKSALEEPGCWSAVVHGDVCPDNVLQTSSVSDVGNKSSKVLTWFL